MNKKYTISIPVQVDYVDNQMSPQIKTIDIEVKATSVTEAVWKFESALSKLIEKISIGVL
jgi:hypothetical protein